VPVANWCIYIRPCVLVEIGILKGNDVRTLIVLASLVLSINVQADMLTEKQNDVLAYAVAGLIVVDWGLTLDIENHDNIAESNKVLGAHPSRTDIGLYSVLKLALHYWANQTESREAWNLTTGLITGYGVANNLSLGLSVNF